MPQNVGAEPQWRRPRLAERHDEGCAAASCAGSRLGRRLEVSYRHSASCAGKRVTSSRYGWVISRGARCFVGKVVADLDLTNIPHELQTESFAGTTKSDGESELVLSRSRSEAARGSK